MADDYETLSDVIYYSQWGPLSSLKYLNPPAQYLFFRDDTGTTALHYACANGHTDIVDWILKEIKKLDNSNFKNLINITNNKGNTPLHWAAFKGHVDTVQLLLDYGASTTIKNQEDRTPIDDALLKGHQECAERMIEATKKENK